MASRKKPTPTPPPSTEEKYLDFLRSIQIKGIGVDQAGFAIQRGLLAQAVEDGKQIQTGFNAKYELLLNEGERFVVSSLTEVKRRTEGVDEDLMIIQCMFTALFESPPDFNPSFREQFSQNQAKLIFWPYVRQFVSDATAKMSTDHIVLPLTVAP